MATDAQIAANRRNSQKSTGPKTPEGKKTVSQNAVRHGLLSTNVLVPGEDPEAYQLFAYQMFEELQPDGILERMLVKRIIDTQWRLERLAQVEAALYLQQESLTRHNGDGTFRKIPIETAEPAEWEQALDALNPGACTLGGGFERRNGSFMSLQRYEAHLHKLLDRSLKEFHQLQYGRAVDAQPHAVSRMKQVPSKNLPSAGHFDRPAQPAANPFDPTEAVVRFRHRMAEREALLQSRRVLHDASSAERLEEHSSKAAEEPLQSEPTEKDALLLRKRSAVLGEEEVGMMQKNAGAQQGSLQTDDAAGETRLRDIARDAAQKSDSPVRARNPKSLSSHRVRRTLESVTSGGNSSAPGAKKKSRQKPRKGS